MFGQPESPRRPHSSDSNDREPRRTMSHATGVASSCSRIARHSRTSVRRMVGSVVKRSASGLVTALEPLVEACSGIWVAHGAGNADTACADDRGGLNVPPANPQYRLRYVWLPDARAPRVLLRLCE